MCAQQSNMLVLGHDQIHCKNKVDRRKEGTIFTCLILWLVTLPQRGSPMKISFSKGCSSLPGSPQQSLDYADPPGYQICMLICKLIWKYIPFVEFSCSTQLGSLCLLLTYYAVEKLISTLRPKKNLNLFGLNDLHNSFLGLFSRKASVLTSFEVENY